MEPEKKPSGMDGVFWKVLAVISVATSITGLILAIISMAR